MYLKIENSKQKRKNSNFYVVQEAIDVIFNWAKGQKRELLKYTKPCSSLMISNCNVYIDSQDLAITLLLVKATAAY